MRQSAVVRERILNNGSAEGCPRNISLWSMTLTRSWKGVSSSFVISEGVCSSLTMNIVRIHGAKRNIDVIQQSNSPESLRRDWLTVVGRLIPCCLRHSLSFWACLGSDPSTQVMTASTGGEFSVTEVLYQARLNLVITKSKRNQDWGVGSESCLIPQGVSVMRSLTVVSRMLRFISQSALFS